MLDAPPAQARRSSVLSRALIATLTPILALGVATTLVVGWFVADELGDNIGRSALAEAERQTFRLGRFVDARRRLLEVIARSDALRSGELPRALRRLAEEKEALSSLYEGLYFNELDGTVHGPGGVTFSVADRAYWPRVLRGEVVAGELITSRATGRRVALFVVPIRDREGRHVGALGGTALLEETLGDIAATAAILGGVGGVVDAQGGVISGAPITAELARATRGGLSRNGQRTVAGTVEVGDTTWRYWATSVPTTGWHHILAWPEAELFAPVTTLRFLLAGLIVLALGGALFAAWALRRNLARPLSAITTALERFASEPATRAPLSGPAELARLAATFNQTADRLATETAERLRLENELAHAARIESIGRLAGGVAHDFNNLLTVILTLTDLMRDQLEDPMLRDDLDAITEAAHQAAALTSQLLIYARRGHRAVEVFPIDEAITGFAPMLRRLMTERVRLELSLDAKDLRVELDPTELLQVLLNLCTNARDAMPQGGRVTVSTRLAGDMVELVVEDEGHGIPDAQIPHIFEPFYSTKGAGRGTGLGLSTCFGIATRAGGKITLENRHGHGARFIVTLPRSHAVRTQTTHRPASSPSRRRVLLVEDAVLVRETTRLLLERAGHEVTACDSAESARAELAEPFEVLVTDLRMPGESGASLSRFALATWPELRVVLISGYLAEEDLSHLENDPRVRLLPKPFTSKALLDAVGGGGPRPAER